VLIESLLGGGGRIACFKSRCLCLFTVDDMQSGVSDIHHRATFASISTAIHFHSSTDDRHVQVRCQQEPAENQLPHIHGQYIPASAFLWNCFAVYAESNCRSVSSSSVVWRVVSKTRTKSRNIQKICVSISSHLNSIMSAGNEYFRR